MQENIGSIHLNQWQVVMRSLHLSGGTSSFNHSSIQKCSARHGGAAQASFNHNMRSLSVKAKRRNQKMYAALPRAWGRECQLNDFTFCTLGLRASDPVPACTMAKVVRCALQLNPGSYEAEVHSLCHPKRLNPET